MEMDRLKKANKLAEKMDDIESLIAHVNHYSTRHRATLELAVEHELLNIDTIKFALTAHFKTKLELLKEEFEAL